MVTKLAPSVEDMLALPDDGYRHELIFGVHHVSPAPGSRHQRALGKLFIRLAAICPRGQEVILAPFAWVIADPSGTRHEVQPDLLVIGSGPDRDRLEDEVPALVVEILSPGAANRARDLEDKFALYEAVGVPAYWVVDPEVPSLRAWRLVERRLTLVADVRRGEAFSATAEGAPGCVGAAGSRRVAGGVGRARVLCGAASAATGYPVSATVAVGSGPFAVAVDASTTAPARKSEARDRSRSPRPSARRRTSRRAPPSRSRSRRKEPCETERPWIGRASSNGRSMRE